ncbi:uncharacterized protein ARMOST_12372 [Armillaria ostoyae]|uniref:Peptidase C14 caspase domain-containing protein n=1 Tax=Armillaria ostoyae TaxID=47428 RepID=A0A284RJR4_ARMOS|nr:uncharacterized protein ARMOST_12372 [Armillaria ostoyae]
MPSQRAPGIYVPMLIPRGHGYPLWVPRPHSGSPIARRGIEIGDLGYLADDGSFVFLFNVCRDAQDPVNQREPPPPGFVKLDIQGHGTLTDEDRYNKNSSIRSYGMQKKSFGLGLSVEAPIPVAGEASFEFTSSREQGAVLVLPDGGKSYDSPRPARFYEYAVTHALSWFEHYNGQGRQIRNGMLYLVTGCDKCHSWANACFSRSTQSRSASFKLSTGPGIDGTVRYTWEVQNDEPVNSGVARRNSTNQTVFVRGYSISVRGGFRRIVKKPVKATMIGMKRDKPPKIGSSVPFESSRTPASTTTDSGTQGQGAETGRGAAGFGSSSEIEGYSYDEYSGSEVLESSEDESETDPSVMDIPYGHTDPGKVDNPSALINKYILDTYPDATIALTHDDFEWTGIENNVRNPLDVVELANYAIDNDLVFISESPTIPDAWVAEQRDIVMERFSRKNDIFALIIGIDKYQRKDYSDLQGACSDADKFEAFLLEDLQTPKANIVSLRDGKATRSAIINELIEMKDNTVVQQDVAAFIIYFAGYGAATTDPVGQTDGNTSNKKIEMLCPTDIGIVDKNNGIVNGIPARTINQLLSELSSFVEGNNIILILDCSYAAIPSDAQKSADVPAGTEPRQIFDPPKLSPRCDQQIYSGPGKKLVSKFGSSLLDSHVLLAACSPLQFAYESQGEGLFTRELLKVLKEWPINELTYISLIHRLDMPVYQTPLSKGSYIDQCLFDSRSRTADSYRILCHHEKDQPYFTLCAGSDHGTVAGSVYEIYRTDLPDKQHPFTTATVERVEAGVFFLKPADQTIFTIHKNRRIWYARSADNLPKFTIYCNDSNFLARILNEGVKLWLMEPPHSVNDPRLAHLCLMVDDSDVFYKLGERTTGWLFRWSLDFSPRFSFPSKVHAIAEILEIIDCYAYFTLQVMMASPLPMADLVSVEMKEVRPSGFYFELVGENLLPDAADKFVELCPFPEIQKRTYGFTVNNTSDDPLYVSLFAFNSSDLKIRNSFSSTTWLEPGRTRTFGDGNKDGGEPIKFFIPDDLDEDVTVLKFFVTEHPINPHILSLQSPFSERLIEREAWDSFTLGKRWASMTIPIILRRNLVKGDTLKPLKHGKDT